MTGPVSRRLLAALAAALVLLSSGGQAGIPVASALVIPADIASPGDAAFAAVAAARTDGTAIPYRDYLALHGGTPPASGSLEILPAETVGAEGCTVLASLGGWNGPILATGETGFATFEIDVPETALYQAWIEYYPLPGRGGLVERSLQVDGTVPFREAERIVLPRVFRDSVRPGDLRDRLGNDLIPLLEEDPRWEGTWIRDASGLQADPLSFHLEAGLHRLTLSSVREPVAIRRILLARASQAPSVTEFLNDAASGGLTDMGAYLQVVQAEQAGAKSDSTLVARSDRTSPATFPYDPVRIRMNTIGGRAWSTPGQWIEWVVRVPEDGLYRLSFRSRQNYLSGSFCTRRLSVNGEVQYRDLEDLRFPYGLDWDWRGPATPVRLQAGDNVIRLEVTLGQAADLVSRMEAIILDLNRAYRKVVMVTGAVPDPFRDYLLDRKLPEVFAAFSDQAKALRQMNVDLMALTGGRGSLSAVLQSLAVQLDEFTERPEEVQNRLASFKSNIGALGTWVISVRQQPIEIDTIAIHGPDALLPPARAGFLRSLAHEIRSFLASFLFDYSDLGDVETGTAGAIEVWVQTGRDQASILKELIDNDFTPGTGIPVVLKLVQNQLLPATVAGRGPDVALQCGGAEPINYAIRSAVEDLSAFPTFPQVTARFRDSALLPFTLDGKVFALPETHTFPMFFYRLDIFAELSLQPPDTWDDFRTIAARLQKNNMNAGLQPIIHSLGTFLYQLDGTFYIDDGRRSGLSETAAVEAFRLWTALYTDYSLPYRYDAANRFRTGEMPAVIEDYTFFNLLSLSAPEIWGLWDFGPVPGIRKQDGTLDRDVAGGGNACMMLRNSRAKEKAWAFLDWYTSDAIQLRFGQRIESLLGTSARYPTANVEAFRSLPWTARDLGVLEDQWRSVRAIPEVPGGYYTSRHVNNAFRRVLFQEDEPKETLLEYVEVIDDEIRSKRNELGLDAEGDGDDAE